MGEEISDFNGNPIEINIPDNLPNEKKSEIINKYFKSIEGGFDYGTNQIDFNHVLTGQAPKVAPQDDVAIGLPSPQGEVKSPQIDDSKLTMLNAGIRGFGEGMAPGVVENVATPISALYESIKSGKPYADEKSKLYEENIALRKKFPATSQISEIAGMLNPKSAFGKLYGAISVPAKAGNAAKMAYYAAKGAIAGGGNEAIRSITDIFDKNKSLDAGKRIAGATLSGGLVGGLTGPIGEKIESQFAKPKGGSDAVEELRNLYKNAPELYKKTVAKFEGELATKSSIVGHISNILKKHGVLDDSGNKIKKAASVETVIDGQVLGGKEKNQLLNFLKTVGASKNGSPKTVGDLVSLKQKWGDAIKDVPQGKKQLLNNEMMIGINNALKEDIISGITKTQGDKVGEQARQAYDAYSRMKKVNDIINIKPNGYLSVDGTLKNIGKYSDNVIKSIFGKNADKVINLRETLIKHSLSGVKEVKLPESQAKTIMNFVKENSLTGLGMDGILKVFELTGSGIKKIPTAYTAKSEIKK